MFLDVLTGFIEELRAAGIPVSMVEAIDAMEAIRQIDLADRDALKTSLGATLVKNIRHYGAFETAFEIYFALDRPASDDIEPEQETPPGAPSGAGGGSLMEALAAALGSSDDSLLRALAQYAVRRFAGMEKGRPVGGTYYLYRALRPFDLDGAVERLVEDAEQRGLSAIEERLLREAIQARVGEFREEVQAEVRRRLVADRGREAVAITLRTAPLEDMDLMHATREELQGIERALHPLTRKLAARLAERRRRGRVGRLDFRRTVRSSLSTGGVLLEPKFRVRKPSRPDIMLLSDISGSMATFARFTLQFVYAMAAQFSRLRSFAFIDGLDEVTGFFSPGVDFEDAISCLHEEAEVLWFDGHSDYGHSLEMFWERYGSEITPKATVIVAGDARTNYRDPRPDLLAEIASSARSVYWLNPEPRAYWNTGDSVMRVYEPFSRAFEVRTLRQLGRFVEQVTS
ncbi:MAG: VWA domain-containing protein [Gammaproteobacteria bacterium]|nr:VWA domain-containing protein [Gammaproteobacteria bacterium]